MSRALVCDSADGSTGASPLTESRRPVILIAPQCLGGGRSRALARHASAAGVTITKESCVMSQLILTAIGGDIAETVRLGEGPDPTVVVPARNVVAVEEQGDTLQMAMRTGKVLLSLGSADR